MYCCANCFGHSFLDRRIPEISDLIGSCTFCHSENTVVVEPAKLVDYFQSVCSIYVESASADAKTLVRWFQNDWHTFSSLDSVTAQALLGEILNDGEIVRKKHVPGTVPVLDAVQKWAAFRDEIMWRNRFFLNHELDLERLEALFDTYLRTDASGFGNLLYRARIQPGDMAIPLNEMGRPPAASAKNGRANPVGIPYLYVASTPETAIAETRPHPGDLISVAQLRVISPLHLLNLLHPRKTISPYEIFDENELSSLRVELAFLCHLENELSKPILPRVADLEYLPTQYLCEFIKNCKYDGVIFKSSISSGANIALFEDSKTRAEVLTQYEVTRLLYEQTQR